MRQNGHFEAFLSDYCMNIYESKLLMDHFHTVLGRIDTRMMKSEVATALLFEFFTAINGNFSVVHMVHMAILRPF